MHAALALLCVALAFLLTRTALRMVDSGALNLGLAGVVVRKERPASFWCHLVGLVAVIVLLLLLTGVLLVPVV